MSSPKYTKANPLKVWHFCDVRTRDGADLPRKGEERPAIKSPIPCVRGYHGSENVLDALAHAPGCNLARVGLYGTTKHDGAYGHEKWVASNRRNLTDYHDATKLLLHLSVLVGVMGLERRLMEHSSSGSSTLDWRRRRRVASAIEAGRKTLHWLECGGKKPGLRYDRSMRSDTAYGLYYQYIRQGRDTATPFYELQEVAYGLLDIGSREYRKAIHALANDVASRFIEREDLASGVKP